MLHIFKKDVVITTEVKLCRMRELTDSIKVLQSELDMLKDEVKQEYFNDNPIYKTSKGLILATYNWQERKTFNQTKFKKDHPDYYDMYSEITQTRSFLLK